MNLKDRTLLLVEDNPDDEELVHRALKKADLAPRVLVAHDGLEAFDFIINSRHAAPDLVLLDLKMPKVDGFEVLARARADPRFRKVPIVVFTSSSEATDVEKAYELGASSYVRKPIEFAEFSTAVEALVHYWLVHNVGPPRSPRRIRSASH